MPGNRSSKASRVTMNHVAERAGVSQTTVSIVLNNTPGIIIAQDTRERVMEAVKDLKYRPNTIAQNLRTQRSDTIGFITDEIAISPFAGRIFEGAQDAAWEAGKILLLVNTKRQPDLERAAAELLRGRQVEGLIFATMYHHAVELPPTLEGLPTVLLDCYVEDRSLPSVVPDEEDGGYRATRALIDKGHQRIAFLNNVDPIPASSGRLAGYKRALMEAGLPLDESLTTREQSDQAGGYRATLKLMQRENAPTALFCFNDRMAMGAYDALRKLNLRIPEDVAVVGFDNQETIAANLYPPLSTMALPHYEMGVWAVNYLIQPPATQAEPVQQVMECVFVERAST